MEVENEVPLCKGRAAAATRRATTPALALQASDRVSGLKRKATGPRVGDAPAAEEAEPPTKRASHWLAQAAQPVPALTLRQEAAGEEAASGREAELLARTAPGTVVVALPGGSHAAAIGGAADLGSHAKAAGDSPPELAPTPPVRKRPRGQDGEHAGPCDPAPPPAAPAAAAVTVHPPQGAGVGEGDGNPADAQVRGWAEAVCDELAHLVDEPLARSVAPQLPPPGPMATPAVAAAAAAAALPACIICRQIPVRPQVAALCGHFACGECWAGWIRHKFECPVCRKKVRPNNLIRLRGWGEP